MKKLFIAIFVMTSIKVIAQDKNKDRKHDIPFADSIEWVITPDGKDTLAYKYKGKDPVIKDATKLTIFYWQTRKDLDFLARKMQIAQYSLSLVNATGQVIDPSRFFTLLSELYKD